MSDNRDEFDEIFSGINYSDDFGWSQDWCIEMNKWLIFAKSIDTVWYEKNKKRLVNRKQRDELLGEFKSLYFVGKISQCKILSIEPDGKDNHKNDFLFEDKDHEEWYVEVKSPSWMSEVSKKIDNEFLEKLQKTIVITDASSWEHFSGEITCPNCSQVLPIVLPLVGAELDKDSIPEIIKNTVCSSCKENIWLHSEKERSQLKKDRLSKPQFINGEGSSFSDKDAVEDAIRKSVEQFAPNRNNLLVITHNMFAGQGIGIFTSMNGGLTVKQLINKYDPSGIISCVCILEVVLDDKGTKFIPVFVPLTKELKL